MSGIVVKKEVINAGNAPAIYIGDAFPYTPAPFGTMWGNTNDDTWNRADGGGGWVPFGGGGTPAYIVVGSNELFGQTVNNGTTTIPVTTVTVPFDTNATYSIDAWVNISNITLLGSIRMTIDFDDYNGISRVCRMFFAESGSNTNTNTMSNTQYYASLGMFIGAISGSPIKVTIARIATPGSTVTFDVGVKITQIN